MSSLRTTSSTLDRRAFFNRVLLGNEPVPMEILAGLEPYKPNEKLSESDALHLLRRTTFAPSKQDVARAMGMTTTQAVNALFSGNTNPTPPSWANINPDTEQFSNPQARITEYYRRYYELQEWWFDQMVKSSFSIVEKMTFFWHNHFCSDYLKVYYPQYMFQQNALFRQYAWGNFRDLTKAVIADPAMLVYLDNVQSIKGNPNENFSRELLELFTLGVNNYTEQDVVEASRALTGWRINGLKGEFRQQLWDPGDKTFLGQKGTWNADDIVRLIMANEHCAKFIATKLYKYFVYEVPDSTIVNQLAGLIVQNNFDLKPVLTALLSSAHFFDAQLRGAIIKSPLEFMISLPREFGVTDVPASYAITMMTQQTLELLNPPTVEGWKGYHLWINTNTYPLRQRIAEYFIDGRRMDNRNLPTKPDVVTFAKQFSTVDDPRKFVADVARYVLAIEPGDKTKEVLLEELLQGAPDYEWSITMSGVDFRLRSFLKALLILPEFQLM